jgi:hypothetical protein
VIRYLKQRSGNAFPVIGVGGIHCAQDALDKIDAGADLVQLYTGFIYKGPALINEINTKLIARQAAWPNENRIVSDTNLIVQKADLERMRAKLIKSGLSEQLMEELDAALQQVEKSTSELLRLREELERAKPGVPQRLSVKFNKLLQKIDK